MSKKHFDDKFIDEIVVDADNNYFSGVLNYCMKASLPKVVCDIGCGNGVFTSTLKNSYDCKLIGLDGSPHALKKASKLNFDKLHHLSDFSNDVLPIDSNSVDLVICKDVMEHLLDPFHLTKEIFRITKPGGFALIHVPNHFPIWGRVKFLFTNNIDTFSYFSDSDRYEYPHIRFFTLGSVINMITRSGFKDVENISYFFTRVPIIHRLIPLSVTKLLAKFSTNSFSEGITILVSKA